MKMIQHTAVSTLGLLLGFCVDAGEPSARAGHVGLHSLPLAVGARASGAFHTPAAQDRYTFIGAVGQRLYFDALKVDGRGAYIQIIGPTGNLVLPNSWAHADAGPFYLMDPGTYTVILSPASDGTAEYDFRLLDMASAVPITLGQTVEGRLDPCTSAAAYQFAGVAGQRLNLQSVSASRRNATWRLVGSGNQNLANANIGSSPGEIVLPNTATYLLLVEGNEPEVEPLSFQVVVSLVSEAAGTASGFGDLHSGTINAGDPPVVFAYTAPAGTWVLYDDQLRNFAPLTVLLKARDGTVIFGGSTTDDKGPLLLPLSGDYTLSVQGNDANSAGAYQFRMLNLSAGSTPLAFGSTVSQGSFPGFQTEAYRFAATAGQQLFLDGLAGAGGNIRIYLYAPSGTWFGGNGSESDFGPVAAPEPGTYYVLVWSSQADAGPVGFRLLDVAQSAVALAGNVTVEGQLDPGMSAALYRFNWPAGTRVFLQGLSGPNSAGFVALWGPANPANDSYHQFNQFLLGGNGWGTSLANNSFSEIPISHPGSYVVVVAATGTEVVPYSFRVSAAPTHTQPLNLGEITGGVLTEPGQVERYTFNAVAGQRLYYDSLENDFASIGVRLIHPSGNSPFLDQNSDYDGGPWTLRETGQYTLAIGGNTAATGSYRFRLLDTAQSPAAALPLNAVVNGAIEGLAATILRFEAAAGQRLYYQDINSTPAGGWTLYGPGNQYINNSSVAANTLLTAPQTGTYLLVLGSAGNFPVPYAFHLWTPPTSTAPLTLGSTVSGAIGSVNEQHRFTFEGRLGQRLYFDTLSGSAASLPVVLLDPNGNATALNQLVSADAGPFTLTSSGTYTVAVGGQNQVTGSYRFRLLDLAGVPTLSANNTGKLDPGNRTDAYQLVGAANQRLQLQSVASPSAAASWRLIGPLNQTLAGAALHVNLGVVTLPQPGTYLVLVEGQPDAVTAPNYQVLMTDVTDGPIAPTGFGAAHAGTINPGEVNSFPYAGTVGMPVFFDSLSPTPDPLTVEWRAPDGTVLAFLNPAGDWGPYYLPSSGTYTLLVRGNDAGSAGNYNFRLLNLDADALPLTLGQATSGQLDLPFKTDVYRFTSTAGQQLYYDALLAYTGASASVSLLGAGGYYYCQGCANVHGDFGPVLLYEAGRCYLFLNSAQAAPVDYRFRLLDLKQAPSQALTLNTVVGGPLQPTPADALNLTGSYVNQNLRSDSTQGDWRLTQTIAGTRHDATIDFASDGWGERAPLGLTGGTDFNWDNFSVQWDGSVNIVQPNTRLYFRSLDSSRLWIDLNQDGTFDAAGPEYLSNNWGNPQGLTYGPGTGPLAPGAYPVRLQYEAGTGDNFMWLLQDTGVSLAPFETAAWYFNAAPGRMFFQSLAPAFGGVYWTAYGPNNETMGSSSLASDFEVNLPLPGTYAIMLRNDNPFPVPVGFKAITPATSTSALTLGAVINGTLAGPGDEARFTFTGAAGQRLYYDSLQSLFNPVNVRLITPSGANDFISANADYDSGPFTLREPGAYMLILHSTSGAPVPYKFRLLDVASAPELALDQVYRGTLDPGTQTLLFQLHPVPNLRLFFNGQSSNPNGNWGLYDVVDSYLGGSGITGDFEPTPKDANTHVLVFSGNASGPLPYAFRAVPANHAPAFPGLTEQAVMQQSLLSFTPPLVDLEQANELFTYALGPGAPDGLTIDPATGRISWTPDAAQAPGLYPVTVQATDNGFPPLTGSATFNIRVVKPLEVMAFLLHGRFVLFWETLPGYTYQAQFKNDLSDPIWTNLGNPVIGSGALESADDLPTGAKHRFFRVEARH